MTNCSVTPSANYDSSRIHPVTCSKEQGNRETRDSTTLPEEISAVPSKNARRKTRMSRLTMSRRASSRMHPTIYRKLAPCVQTTESETISLIQRFVTIESCIISARLIRIIFQIAYAFSTPIVTKQ